MASGASSTVPQGVRSDDGLGDTRSAVDPLWGQLRDEHTETAFRDSDFEQAKRGVVTFVILAATGLLFFTVTESLYMPSDKAFVALQVGRGTLLVLIMCISVVLMRMRSRLAFEKVTFSAAVALPLLAAAITLLRPTNDPVNFMLDLVLILSYYSFFHFPLRILVIPPLLITAVQVFLLFSYKEVDNTHGIHVIITALFLANVVGVLASRHANIRNRLRFLDFRAESNLRAEMETTLDRLELLEGLVPICAHCKRIRGDDGTWEQVEAFVSRGSKLEFSHGICPQCMRERYSDVMDT